MKINTGKEEMDLDFKVHGTGWYLFQIDEGVKVVHGKDKNEPDESLSLQIPLISVQALDEGTLDDVGGKVTMFVYLKSKIGESVQFGENTLAQVLTSCGIAADLEKAFPGDVPFTDQRFLDTIIIKALGKTFRGYVSHKPNFKDPSKSDARITKIRTPKRAPQPQQEAAGPQQQTVSEEW